ncbi:MAG: hypothetical protein II776_03050 [Clostridia bacterium]|nr:hypothetical protein [Clostridia bacterium]
MAAFKIGQQVRYGQSGVCEIREIARMNVGGKAASYYVLAPLFKKGSTVYVPCDNEALTGRMRPLLTPEEIRSVLKKAEAGERPWNRDFRKRSEESRLALQSDDRLDALLMIKSILAHKKELVRQGKHVHTTDDYFLRDAEQLVYNEFAFVLDKSFDEVEDHVRGLLSAP